MSGHGPEEPGKRVAITASQGSRTETEKKTIHPPKDNLILQRRNNRWNALGH